MGRIINQRLRAKKSEEDRADILDNNSVANSDPEENPDGPPYISWIRPESISGKKNIMYSGVQLRRDASK